MSADNNLNDLLVYVRAVHFAAIILAAGVVIFQFLVAEPAFRTAGGNLHPPIGILRRRWTWMVWTSLAVAAVSGAVWLLLLAADIYGAPVDQVWRSGGVWTVAAQTRFGQVWSLRFALGILLAAFMAAPMEPARRTRRSGIAILLAIGVLIGPAWTGHAGATPGAVGQFALASDALHLLAAGAWVGGLLPLAMLLDCLRRRKEPGGAALTADAVRRFSLLGIVSVGLLLASGLINSWYEVGSIDNLIETSYGWLVIAKLALFAAMVAFAAVNRFHLTPRLAAAGAVGRLERNSLAEAALGFTAVLVVGFLGSMAPAIHLQMHPKYEAVPEGAAFIHMHSLEGMADVTIMPGQVGPASATVRLWDDDFDPLKAKALTFALTAPAAGSTPVTRAATQDDSGAWVVDGIALSRAGNWTVTLDADLGLKGHLVLEAPIVIEDGPATHPR
jgi:putative copper resistance protein D